MKHPEGTALQVSLDWRESDVLKVGRIAYRDGVAYFEFAEEFLATRLELSPLRHPAAPGIIRPHDPKVFEGLHGVFHDSLPDGWGRLLVDRRARQCELHPARLTPLDRLSWVADQGMGALVYAPAQMPWDIGEQPLNLNQLALGAERLLRGEAGELISELGRTGGPPAGARPKALVALHESGNALYGTKELPAGYSHQLVKFRGADDPPDAAQIERAYSEMAEAAGIRVPDTRLIRGVKSEYYFASRRFDRDPVSRVHTHTASGLLYADFRTPSIDYKDLILLTRLLTRDVRECRAMFALSVFNVMAHNRDDHARQFTFLMGRDGNWSLAPAYDLTFAEGPGGEHSTSVLGRGRDFTRDDLCALGGEADLAEKDIMDCIAQVADAVFRWRQFAKDSDVSTASLRRIEKQLNSTAALH